jgi:hypothetical protein
MLKMHFHKCFFVYFPFLQVVSELLKSRNVLTSGDCERKRVQRSAKNAPKQFSIPKTKTLDVEKVLSQIQRKEFKVNLNNNEW